MNLNVLFLCYLPEEGKNAGTIIDHVRAFPDYSRHHFFIHSFMGDLPPLLDLSRFDVIIIHYSLSIIFDTYLSASTRNKLRHFQGLKAVFIQDEYRRINAVIEALDDLGIDVLFTCFPEQEMDRIYPTSRLPKLLKVNNLTGYVPKRLLTNQTLKPMGERTIDVGYRARKLPYWYGELAFEKWDIVEKWQLHTRDANLNTDISYHEADRIYGDNWISYIGNCKTTLGVESGASVMDFTGELEQKIDRHQLLHPEDSFFSVQERYLKEHEGKHRLNQISPRCFEAIALKTVLVLYEGEYSGIIQPGRHYISLKKDFSNIQEVIALIKDNAALQAIADCAYEEIACDPAYSYEAFIKMVDEVLVAECLKRKIKLVSKTYDRAAFDYYCHKTTLRNRLIKWATGIYQRLPVRIRLLIKNIIIR